MHLLSPSLIEIYLWIEYSLVKYTILEKTRSIQAVAVKQNDMRRFNQMRLSLSKLGIVFLVVGCAVCCPRAWGEDWREFAEASTGVFYYDKESVTSPSNDFFRVWVSNATRRETSLIEIDCKEKNYRVLDVVEYDETDHIKTRSDYYDNTTWLGIFQKTVPEPLYSILCP
jgi:hypothetical protein